MDVLTGVASIAFSLCSNIFNSFVQYSDYHLISAYHNLSIHPNSPTTLLGLRGIIRLGVLKQYLIAGEVLFSKRLYFDSSWYRRNINFEVYIWSTVIAA